MTMPSASASPQPPARSDFVTVLAWIFIVLSCFAIMMLGMQAIVISTYPFGGELIYDGDQQLAEAMRASRQMMFYILWAMLLVLMFLTGLSLATAIGLLRRRNWARLLFVVFMSLGVLMHIGGLALSPFMFAYIPHMEGAGSPEMSEDFGTLMTMVMGFSVILSIGFVVLFGWIIRRLTSPDIRREFGVA